MILAILEAHAGRTRTYDAPRGVLRGAIMAPLRGEPMIWRQIERIRRARTLTKLVAAVSRDPVDDPLAGYLVSRGLTVFRAGGEDPLAACARCVAAAGPVTHVVRLSADCPLTDPAAIDEAVRLALASRAALVSAPGLPRGLEVEVIRAADLAVADEEAADPAERLSPAAYLRARPDRFAAAGLTAAVDRSGLDWTADRPAGFAFVLAVFDALHEADPEFGLDDVIDFVETRPDLAEGLAAAA